MPEAWKIACAVGAVALALVVGVGLILSWHISGFIRTVEREAQEEAEARRAEDEQAMQENKR